MIAEDIRYKLPEEIELPIERGEVFELGLKIAYPDRLGKHVELNMRGSSYKGAGFIINSQEGAELFAELSSYKYGEVFKEKVLDMWNNKASPSDPYKPTILIVKPNLHDSLPPAIVQACGSKMHPPND
jgi:hypothetical protein